MAQHFNFAEAIKALQSGQSLTGQEGNRAIRALGAISQNILDLEFEWDRKNSKDVKQMFIPNILPLGLAADMMIDAAEQYLDR